MNAESWIRILQQHYPISISNVVPIRTVGDGGVPTASSSVRKHKGPHPERSAWNVHKFGGSSFENADSYSFVASLINKFDGKNLVVVSALSGITNHLYRVCQSARQHTDWLQSDVWLQLITRVSETIKNRLGNSSSGEKETRRFAADLIYLSGVLSRMSTASSEDQQSIEQLVVGYGEIWSARLMTQTLRDDYHRAAAFLDAREVLVVDQDPDLKIHVQWDTTKEKLKKWFYNCRYCDVLVVTGFIARNLGGLPVTLKRNGSDFSATIFSVLTKANSVTIWKDVDGMFTADPKKHPDAVFIPEQTFEEAEEASRRGAFVIQADCIEPAKMFNIPIYLRNCFKLDCPGTRIGVSIAVSNKTTDRQESIGDTRMMEEVKVTVDHLMEAIETLPCENVSAMDHLMETLPVVDGGVETAKTMTNEMYPLCSDSDTVNHTTSHADDHTILEIIV